MRSLVPVIGTVFVAAVLSSCSSTTSPSAAPAADVTIQDFSFSPASVTIKVGSTVRWTNNGPSSHTTTSDSKVWDSGALAPASGGGGGGGGGGYSVHPSNGVSMSSASTAGTFEFAFMQAGTYPYHCSIHPPAMFPGFTGTIIVNP